MPAYRYAFADLLTDRTLVELDLSGVTFDRRIVQPGTFRATYPITNQEQAAQAKRIRAGRTICHVYRNAEIWGSYIIWTAEPSQPARGPITLQLQGADLMSWFHTRLVDIDFDFVAADQFQIVRDLVANAQVGFLPFVESADLGIVVTPNNSGITRDRTYKRSEQTSVGQRLEELANVTNGFEYMIRTYIPTGLNERRREFVLATTLGQFQADHVFEQPGNILGWSLQEDATRGGTAFWARGDIPETATDVTADAEPLIAGPETADTFLSNGWPWIDRTADYQGVSVQATLDEYAQWWAVNRAGPARIPQVTVRLDEQPSFSPNRLGDHARLVLTNDWYPTVDGRPSFVERWRVIGIEVTPETRDGIEVAKLIFEEETA